MKSLRNKIGITLKLSHVNQLTTTGADGGAPAFWIVFCLYQVHFNQKVKCPVTRRSSVLRYV